MKAFSKGFKYDLNSFGMRDWWDPESPVSYSMCSCYFLATNTISIYATPFPSYFYGFYCYFYFSSAK